MGVLDFRKKDQKRLLDGRSRLSKERPKADPVDSLTDELVLSKLANHPRETITRRFFIVDYQYLHPASVIGILSCTV